MATQVACAPVACAPYYRASLASQTYFARARILRAPKRGEGENTSGVFGQVFVCTAGMLAVPIRLQYRVININNT